MILYLDTEFTDLAVHSRLLSIGIVGPTGRGVCFYAEVTDRDRIEDASWFAVAHVLPQFGRMARAACPYSELGRRLGSFLATLTRPLAPGEFIDVAFGNPLDWELLERAIRDGAGTIGAQALGRMRPLNVYQVVRRAAGGIPDKASLAVGVQPSSAHHHALADARTLRWVCEAACDRRSTARPSTRPALSGNDRPRPITPHLIRSSP